MPEKKSAGRKLTAPDAPVAPPAGTASPPAAEPKLAETVSPPAAAPGADAKPAGTKLAAVRMMTRSIVGKKPAAARGETQRVADAAKPSQKPAAGAGRRGPRRGASKGR